MRYGGRMMWRFFDFLFPPRADETLVRGIGVDELLSLLTPTFVAKTNPPTLFLLPFHDQRVRALLHEAKYHGSTHAFQLLGAILSEYLRDSDETMMRPILVPVPLGKKRFLERQYNQTEEIAVRASKEVGIAVRSDMLFRTRDTASQISLPRHLRFENMRGAFRTSSTLDPSFLYIVLDDVTTTGATMQAAIDALAEAGAKHILPLALAH